MLPPPQVKGKGQGCQAASSTSSLELLEDRGGAVDPGV